jgi:hypothetical protein
VTNFVTIISMSLVTLCLAEEVKLWCSTNSFFGQFVNEMSMLSCSFKCVQICSNHHNQYVCPHFVLLLKCNLDVLQTSLCGQFVKQMFMLSCSFQCDRICSNHRNEYVHTLLCCLSVTEMLNKLVSRACLLSKSPCLAASLSVTEFVTIFAINMSTLCFVA